MGFMGNAALHSIIHEANTGLLEAVQRDSSVALFEFLGSLPFSSVTSIVATLLVMLFFVTSADSGSLVTDYLTAKTENSPVWQRLFWTLVMALLAITLLLVGGLEALQSATIMSALPFTLIMLLICWGLLKALRLDVIKMHAVQAARITPRAIQNPRSWQQRLGLIMHYPHSKAEVQAFIDTTASKAFGSFQTELKRRQIQVKIHALEEGIELRVDHQDEMNFIYQVVMTQMISPTFMSELEDDQSYQAEVFLKEGGQGYDVMEWTQEDLLQDIIDQYERHLHFLSLIRSPE